MGIHVIIARTFDGFHFFGTVLEHRIRDDDSARHWMLPFHTS